MSVFIKPDLQADGKYICFGINPRPDLLDEQAKQAHFDAGYIEVEAIPEEPKVIKGQQALLLYSPEDGSMRWTVITVTTGPTIEEKLNALLEQAKTADQRFRDLDPEATPLDQYKAAKVAQLDEWFKLEVAKGYTSIALGESHTYPADEEAQKNLQVVIKRLELAERQAAAAGVDMSVETNRPTFDYQTLDAGALPHHLGELEVVFADGVDASGPGLARFRSLRDQTYAAQTNAEVAAVQP